ncbi:hypothetical protein [Leuconostoc mesenteroides]|uniref:hypothetical protein n=1 Tax=Leuconostoc mesenteroides TaxID=1245 RepID=UPI000B32D1E9|nr:hypothetical protein [Leuconostoc mesenteroides]
MELKLIDNKGNNTQENLVSEKVTKNAKISMQTGAIEVFAFQAIKTQIKSQKELPLV